MEEKKTYYDLLFGATEGEKEIQRKLDEEMERYEASDVYKRHQERLDKLFDELKKAGENRREEAKKHRPQRKKVTPKSLEEEMDEIKRRNQEAREKRIEALPDDLKVAIRSYEGLDDTAKKVFQKETWYHLTSYEYDDYKNPKTTKKDMKELLEILVQTTVDFINERGLTDIYSVGFGANDLQSSAEAGEWHPSTDANIHITGLGKERGKDGKEYSVIQNIGNDYV